MNVSLRIFRSAEKIAAIFPAIFSKAQNLLIFQDFLKLTVETDPLHNPLPPPKNLAKLLKERTLKIVHEWYNSFGNAYRKLQVAYEYLKSCKTVIAFDF